MSKTDRFLVVDEDGLRVQSRRMMWTQSTLMNRRIKRTTNGDMCLNPRIVAGGVQCLNKLSMKIAITTGSMNGATVGTIAICIAASSNR